MATSVLAGLREGNGVEDTPTETIGIELPDTALGFGDNFGDVLGYLSVTFSVTNTFGDNWAVLLLSPITDMSPFATGPTEMPR